MATRRPTINDPTNIFDIAHFDQDIVVSACSEIMHVVQRDMKFDNRGTGYIHALLRMFRENPSPSTSIIANRVLRYLASTAAAHSKYTPAMLDMLQTVRQGLEQRAHEIESDIATGLAGRNRDRVQSTGSAVTTGVCSTVTDDTPSPISERGIKTCLPRRRRGQGSVSSSSGDVSPGNDILPTANRQEPERSQDYAILTFVPRPLGLGMSMTPEQQRQSEIRLDVHLNRTASLYTELHFERTKGLFLAVAIGMAIDLLSSGRPVASPTHSRSKSEGLPRRKGKGAADEVANEGDVRQKGGTKVAKTLGWL